MKKGYQIAAGSAAGLLGLTALAGAGFFVFACGRRKKEDYWDPAVLDEQAPFKKEETLAVRDWLETQPTEEVYITSLDGLKLWGMLIPAKDAKGTVLCMHGWHGDWKSNWACFIRFFNDRGYNVLVTNERAHGKSQGTFITYGIREREDVYMWVRWIAGRFGKKHPIFLAGISMGSATVQMASSMQFEGNVCGIYADCGYTSPYEIMKCVIGEKSVTIGGKKLSLPPKPMLALLNVYTKLFAGFGLKDYSTTEALSVTDIPVLFVHGTGDDFVPYPMTVEGYGACASEKQLILVEGAAHTRSWYNDRKTVSEALDAFLKKYTPEQ